MRRLRMSISLLIAPVAPEPVKITRSSGPPPTARWMIARASSRNAVVCRPGGPRPPCGGGWWGRTAVARALGVRVGVERHHLVAQEVLDEAERPARRGVVRIRDAPRAVRPV